MINSVSPLLEVRNLRVGFKSDSEVTFAAAVDDVSFNLYPGQTLCLVGESGCGKSVSALSLFRLLPSPPAVLLGGSVFFNGQSLTEMSENAIRCLRGTEVGMVFQDPMTSLNPVMRIGVQITEGLKLFKALSAEQARVVSVRLLEQVGMPDPESRVDDFPHQMSGGMRQRVMIGMALAGNPKLIIADEPTTALDVTVQGQILLLLKSLIKDQGRSLLLITHDIGVVAQIADSVAVMYAGKIVEQGPVADILSAPMHPYTQGLLRSLPVAAKGRERLETIPGTVPGLSARPPGCSFHPRCAKMSERCKTEMPHFTARTGSAEHKCRCLLYA